MTASPDACDVVVVGGGIAGLAAALGASEAGASVVLLEKAPREERGGNTRFADAQIRFPHEADQYGARAYTPEEFRDDLMRLSRGRANAELIDVLVSRAGETVDWLSGHGIAWDEGFPHTAGYRRRPAQGGQGLVDTLFARCEAAGVSVRYAAAAGELLLDGRGAVRAARCRTPQGVTDAEASGGVVLATGGFQANVAMRVAYLGRFADSLILRGSRFDTGDGICMALDAGAQPTGNWSGGHAVAWDRNAPEFGDLTVGDNFQKHNYPFSIMINANGERFVDEGADFRNYTYAKYGRVILMQPKQFCWQVFDSKVLHLLRDEYRIKRVTKVRADTLEELVAKLEDVDADKALATIRAYNAAVKTDVPFNPNVKDGRCTVGLTPPKSNWAIVIDTPPFEAYAVTCGLTFTFGGLKIDTSAHVIDSDGQVIPGLFAAGELVGGLFYFNYPGGTGLMNGAVFGKIAGTSAGQRAAQMP